MIEVDNTDLTISINRADAAIIDVYIPLDDGDNYMFQNGDTITLRVYNKNGYDQEALLEKTITLTSESEIAQIPLTEEDMLFAPIANKSLTYWYDISLNEDKTIIGFDEDGAKQFIVNPAKGGNE